MSSSSETKLDEMVWTCAERGHIYNISDRGCSVWSCQSGGKEEAIRGGSCTEDGRADGWSDGAGSWRWSEVEADLSQSASQCVCGEQ